MARDYSPSGYPKCRSTGKVSFPSKTEARIMMQKLRWTLLMKRNKVDGTRLKRRMGKIVQRRIYYCELCKGYHLTKWAKHDYHNYQLAQKKW